MNTKNKDVSDKVNCKVENSNMGEMQYYKSQDKGRKLRLKNNIVSI